MPSACFGSNQASSPSPFFASLSASARTPRFSICSTRFASAHCRYQIRRNWSKSKLGRISIAAPATPALAERTLRMLFGTNCEHTSKHSPKCSRGQIIASIPPPAAKCEWRFLQNARRCACRRPRILHRRRPPRLRLLRRGARLFILAARRWCPGIRDRSQDPAGRQAFRDHRRRAGFFGVEVGRSFDVAIPVCAEPIINSANPHTPKRYHWWLAVIGRLKPGWTSLAPARTLQPSRLVSSKRRSRPPTLRRLRKAWHPHRTGRRSRERAQAHRRRMRKAADGRFAARHRARAGHIPSHYETALRPQPERSSDHRPLGVAARIGRASGQPDPGDSRFASRSDERPSRGVASAVL